MSPLAALRDQADGHHRAAPAVRTAWLAAGGALVVVLGVVGALGGNGALVVGATAAALAVSGVLTARTLPRADGPVRRPSVRPARRDPGSC